MRVKTVKKARKDYPKFGIKKGDAYYWWKFRFGPVIKSKTYPTRSQLTQSSFLQQVYGLQDDGVNREDLEGSRDEMISQLQDLMSECEDSLSNMPDHLQEDSSSGQMLQERIDGLQEWIDNLEAIDCVVDEDLSEEEREERIDEIVEELEEAGSIF